MQPEHVRRQIVLVEHDVAREGSFATVLAGPRVAPRADRSQSPRYATLPGQRRRAQDGGRSGGLCLEIDEATQRRAVIPEPGTLATNGCQRGRGDRRGRRPRSHRLWHYGLGHLECPVVLVTGDAQAAPLSALMDGSRTRPAGVSVGSEVWLRLLCEGGIEDPEQLLG
jgi:hypothetical protein